MRAKNGQMTEFDYIFVDESFSESVFCLAGVLVTYEQYEQLLNRIKSVKRKLGLEESDFLKYSLGDSEEERKIKDKLQKTLRGERDWLTTFRSKVLDVASSSELTLIASLHQDVRQVLSRESPVDFYLAAFRFLLQRIYFIVKDGDRYHKIFIIVDSPPESKKLKGTEKEICKCYAEAFNSGFQFDNRQIHPLKNFGFYESPLFTKTAFNSLLQIADFCAGTIRQRGIDLLKNKPDAHSKEFFKKLIPKFHRTNERDIVGKGLVVFPKDKKLYQLISDDITDLSVLENEPPF